MARNACRCATYQAFFRRIDSAMTFMARELRHRRLPASIMITWPTGTPNSNRSWRKLAATTPVPAAAAANQSTVADGLALGERELLEGLPSIILWLI